MKYSLSYYITLFVIKLKGIKSIFRKDPIDYKKLRKEDVHKPKGVFYRDNKVRSFKISDSLITEVSQVKPSGRLLIFVHGGAFISGPAKHHWDTIKSISKQTNYTIWMCDYPKAPENRISNVSENIDQIYNSALDQYDAGLVTLIGDSVGGTLVTALIQRLVIQNIQLPHRIILVSPSMDATMSNSRIDEIDSNDPMLSKVGVISAKRMCAENNDLANAMMSPIYGSFESFPNTILFLAENDITYPDQLLVVQKLRKANINFEIFEGKGMPHIWPFLPFMKESKIALNLIIDKLKT